MERYAATHLSLIPLSLIKSKAFPTPMFPRMNCTRGKDSPQMYLEHATSQLTLDITQTHSFLH